MCNHCNNCCGWVGLLNLFSGCGCHNNNCGCRNRRRNCCGCNNCGCNSCGCNNWRNGRNNNGCGCGCNSIGEQFGINRNVSNNCNTCNGCGCFDAYYAAQYGLCNSCCHND